MPLSLNEPSISFSPTLAATIGLEETILLSTLYEAQQWLAANKNCYRIYQPQLERTLPFWQAQDIQRIAKNLVDQGILQIYNAPYTQSLCLEFQFTQHNALNQQAAAHEPLSTQQRNPSTYGANLIAANWQPNRDVLAQLAQHQIPLSFIEEQVRDFTTYWRERGEVSHVWGSRFVKHTLRNWQYQRSTTSLELQPQTEQAMCKSWYPSEDALTILGNTGIPVDFIEGAIAEFTLYWQERGDASNTWNSLFVKHVKRQWASYSNTLQYDSEPKLISKDWQPSSDAIEVLQLANIDLHFAHTEIPSFVLFWLENKQMHSSWNSKYIQHVKYQWAKRHHINIEYAHERQQQTATTSTTKDSDFIRRHSDTSWADGL